MEKDEEKGRKQKTVLAPLTACRSVVERRRRRRRQRVSFERVYQTNRGPGCCCRRRRSSPPPLLSSPLFLLDSRRSSGETGKERENHFSLFRVVPLLSISFNCLNEKVKGEEGERGWYMMKTHDEAIRRMKKTRTRTCIKSYMSSVAEAGAGETVRANHKCKRRSRRETRKNGKVKERENGREQRHQRRTAAAAAAADDQIQGRSGMKRRRQQE